MTDFTDMEYALAQCFYPEAFSAAGDNDQQYRAMVAARRATEGFHNLHNGWITDTYDMAEKLEDHYLVPLNAIADLKVVAGDDDAVEEILNDQAHLASEWAYSVPRNNS